MTEVRTLAEAVARLPGEAQTSARWVRRAYRGHLGAADWHNDTVYVSPATPRRLLYSVVAHEWSHLVQVRAHGGSVERTVRALNAAFGGEGFTGADRAADCMARLLGATWTHYTECRDPAWRAEAARLLRDGS